MEKTTDIGTADESRMPLLRSDNPNEYLTGLAEPLQDERTALRALYPYVDPASPSTATVPAIAIGGPGRPTTPGGVRPTPPLQGFYAYVNSRPEDWNTCGQAAIASMLDYYHVDLGIPRTNGTHWSSGEAIDRVKALGFGPDVVVGWGTTPDRIKNALVSCGVPAEVGHSGLFFNGWPHEWNRLLAYVYYSAIPVPVLVDSGMLGGPAFSAHWPIVWKMEYSSSGMRLYLGNWSSAPVSQDLFLQAWAARQLPLGMNHAAVYTGKPKIRF